MSSDVSGQFRNLSYSHNWVNSPQGSYALSRRDVSWSLKRTASIRQRSYMKSAVLLLALVGLLSIAGAQSNEKTIQAQTAPSPARMTLERMGPDERANAHISVEFESSDGQAVSLGRQVERLWNGGQYDEALTGLRNLETRIGNVAIGNSWRKPVPTLTADSWGMDVRIGNRDSLQSISLVLDPTSGHLFAVLRHSSGAPHWSICMSADNGATWDETFTWIGSPPTCIAASVFWQQLYVVYNSPGENAQQVRVRQFLCSDCSVDTFETGAYWAAACTLSVGDTMKEASLVYLRTHPRLYGTFLISDGSVLFCSTHQAPFYPGTGGPNETGECGTIVNAPLRAGAAGDAFHEALAERILPRLLDFGPDLILISAGFDAHERDPLGGLRLTEQDFSEATKRLRHGLRFSFLRLGSHVGSWYFLLFLLGY